MERRATSKIEGAFARDWEDMTDFSEMEKIVPNRRHW